MNMMSVPVSAEMQSQQYVDMSTNAALAQSNQGVQRAKCNAASVRADSPECNLGENDKISGKNRKSKQSMSGVRKQAIEQLSMGIREQQYFCTRKMIKGKVVYERVCLNCGELMRQPGHPIYSKICDKCKPVHGQNITHYKRLTKLNNVIEFYCGCEKCFSEDNPPCLEQYCELCTVPKFTKKVDDELRPMLNND